MPRSPRLAAPALPRLPFAFGVCQVGAEPAVKAEVARLKPGWRFAFSRPGLVTWKTEAPISPDEPLDAVFVRHHGASIGRADNAEQVVALVAPVLQAAGVPARLSVFERDRAKPGDEAPGDSYGPAAEAVRRLVEAAFPPGALFAETRARPGDLVIDVVVAGDEPFLVGLHVHGPTHAPWPGGRPSFTLPPEAPSRAWLKLEEGLAFGRLPLRAGQVALEVGSAPGGASWALLGRGLTVVGVDPGDMDERVLRHPGFTHLRSTLAEVRRESLPPRIDWLLLDVNVAPQVALHQLRRLVSTLRGTLAGALLTLKLNDWGMARDVPALLARVQGMGFSRVRAKQLAHNRQELCVVARP
ncbi:MAG: hypothetical protein KA712_20235 [Myxococcales bacterium]|nr:hypothetical protein [Myxococcales bacterium]